MVARSSSRTTASDSAADQGGSVLASLVARLVETSAQLGADRAALLRAAGTSAEQLQDPDARLPLDRYLDLWAEVRRQLPDAPVEVACARAESAADFGLVGYLAQQSPDLGRALEVLVRYQRLFHDGIGTALEREGEVVRAVFPLSPRVRAIAPIAASCAASLVAGVRLLVGPWWTPARVELPHPEPKHSGALRDFAGAPVIYGQPRCLVELPAGDLALPLLAPDRALAVWLGAQAEATLARLGEVQPMSEAVARRLVELLPRGQGTQQAIARALGIGDRTLQRRLAAEGTTFAALLERSRRQLAEGFLKDPRLSASEVALLLGYADPSTFFRAFKRWTGRTPQQFRAAG